MGVCFVFPFIITVLSSKEHHGRWRRCIFCIFRSAYAGKLNETDQKCSQVLLVTRFPVQLWEISWAMTCSKTIKTEHIHIRGTEQMLINLKMVLI